MDIAIVALTTSALSLVLHAILFVVATRRTNFLTKRIDTVEWEATYVTSILTANQQDGVVTAVRRREVTFDIDEDADALREQFIEVLFEGASDEPSVADEGSSSEEPDDASDPDDYEDPRVLLERYPSTRDEEALSRVTLDPKAELSYYLDHIYGVCDEIVRLRGEPSAPETVESLKDLDDDLDSLMGYYGAMYRETMVRY